MLYLAWTLRLAAAFVLLAAAVGKLRAGRPARDELTVSARRLGAPVRLAGLVAPATLVAEVAIAGMVCLTGTAVAGCLAATVLFGVFSVGVARLVARGNGARCRCFGAASDLSARHVIRNLALVALAGVAAAATSAAPHATPPPAVLALAAACAAPIAAAFVRWDDLAILFAGVPSPGSNKKGR